MRYVLRSMIFTLVLVVLDHAVVNAQNDQLRADAPLVKELLDRSRKTTSLKAAFTQERHMKVLSRPMVSTGMIRFELPGKMRWQVNEPIALVTVMDGKTVRIRENGVEREATSTDKQVFTAISGLIGGILSGSMLEGQDMDALYFRTDDGLRVELTPKDPRMAKRIERILLLFHSGDMMLRELTLEDPNGDRTLLRFHQPEFGVAHPAGSFTIP